MNRENNEMLSRIKQVITENESFLVATHTKPDGDGIGSQLAVVSALKKMGKGVVGVTDSIPEMYTFLNRDGFLLDIEQLPRSERTDVFIIVDSSNPDRCTLDNFPVNSLVINIDHHSDNTKFGDINYIDSNASSAGVLVYRLLRYMNINIDSIIADYLYTAILTDTGRFSFSNTDSESFHIAAHLVELGASPQELTYKIYKDYSFKRAEIFSNALVSLQSHLDGKVITLELSHRLIEDLNINRHETDGIIDYPQGIQGQEAVFFFKEFDIGEVKVSMRSKGIIDVQRIAAKFGGGGHPFASACSIQSSIREAKAAIIRECKKQLK